MTDHDADVVAVLDEVTRQRAREKEYRIDRIRDAYLAALTDAGYVVVKADELQRLRTDLDEAQLRSIEARNPGIDMDEVRRARERPAAHDATTRPKPPIPRPTCVESTGTA